jgi:hypothetical protein
VYKSGQHNARGLRVNESYHHEMHFKYAPPICHCNRVAVDVEASNLKDQTTENFCEPSRTHGDQLRPRTNLGSLARWRSPSSKSGAGQVSLLDLLCSVQRAVGLRHSIEPFVGCISWLVWVCGLGSVPTSSLLPQEVVRYETCSCISAIISN